MFKEAEMIKGYKFFKEGFRSKYSNMQYEVGKTYTYDGEIKLYKSGFHFSKKLEDAFLNCSYSAKHCCKVEGRGGIIKSNGKIVCSEIYIKEELDFNSVLRKLSKRKLSIFKNKLNFVRWAVAENKNCPGDILRKLYKDKCYYIRATVALNKNCFVDVLKKLSEDENYIVRSSVAINKNCPEDILRKLSEDENWYVKTNVTYNKSCPKDILKDQRIF